MMWQVSKLISEVWCVGDVEVEIGDEVGGPSCLKTRARFASHKGGGG